MRVAGDHGSNAVRSAGQGCANTPDPLTITNLLGVDHGYPRSYGTRTPADPLGDILTAYPGCPTTSRTRLKNRGLSAFAGMSPSRSTRRVALRDGDMH
jgi:hypothetical protein